MDALPSTCTASRRGGGLPNVTPHKLTGHVLCHTQVLRL